MVTEEPRSDWAVEAPVIVENKGVKEVFNVVRELGVDSTPETEEVLEKVEGRLLEDVEDPNRGPVKLPLP